MNNQSMFVGDMSKGFSEALKLINHKASNVYFPETKDFICDQSIIQEKSYQLINKLFEQDDYKPDSLLAFVCKVDTEEFKLGFIDLSSPEKQIKKCENPALTHMNNEKILRSLKNPFSQDFIGDEFGEQILKLLTQTKGKPQEKIKPLFHDFLNHYGRFIVELNLFCNLLHLLCTSQSLYIFTFHMAKNSNFAMLMELSILFADGLNQNYPFINDLAKKIYNVYINNLTIRIFNESNLGLVNQFLGIRGLE